MLPDAPRFVPDASQTSPDASRCLLFDAPRCLPDAFQMPLFFLCKIELSCPATSPTSVVAVEYYYILIIIIVVGPGAWLSHSAAEGYHFFSEDVTTLARNAAPPTGVLCGLCFLPPQNSSSVQ